MGFNVNPYSNTPIKNLEYIQNKALVIAPFEITKSGLLDTDLMLDTPGTITMYFFRKNFNDIDKEPTSEQFKTVGTVSDINTKLGLDISASNISSSITSSYYLGFTKISVIFKYDKNTGMRTIEKDNSLLGGNYIDISIDSSIDLTTEDYFVICNVTKNTKATNSSFTESSSMDFIFMIPSSECQEIITDFDILDANNKTINVKKYGTLGSGFEIDNDTTIEPAYQSDFFGDGSNIATYLFDGTCRDLNGNYNGTPTDITYGEGKFGQCAIFNGTSSKITTNLNISTNNFTFSFWAKLSSSQVDHAFILGSASGDYRYGIRMKNAASIFPNIWNKADHSYNSSSNWSSVANTFALYTFSCNNNVVSFYINGALKGSVTMSSNLPILGAIIGASSNGHYLSGSISHIRVFDRAITQAEVTALYLNTGVPRVIKQESNVEKLAMAYDYATDTDFFGDGSNVANYLLRNNVNDVAGKYNGTVTGTLTYNESGYIQSSTTGSIDLGNPHGNSNIVTISAWVCWNGANQKIPFVVGKQNMYFYGGGLGFNSAADVYGTVSTGFSGVWRHLVIEFHTGEYGKLWIDGVPQTLTQRLGTITKSNFVVSGATIKIFYPESIYTDFGAIKNIKIFNRAVSNIEAKALYSGRPLKLQSKPDFFKDGSNIATYLFNGNCNDETGSYNGTATGITYTKGKFGQAAVFNGAASTGILTKNYIPSEVFAVSLWINASANGLSIYTRDSNTVGQAFGLYLMPSGKIIFQNEYVSGSYISLISNYTITLNTWVHVYVERINNTVKLYINGVLDNTSVSNNWNLLAVTLSQYPMTLGKRWYQGTTVYPSFKGQIDNVRIFNRALNQREVLDLYNEQPSYEEQLTLTEVTGKTLTPSGNPLVVYDRDNGPSIKFDGLSYFTIPSSNDFSFGTGDFTVECLINTSSQTNQMIFDTVIAGQSGAQTGRLAIYLTATGKVEIYNGSYLTSTNSISYTQINHIAITRTNSILKIFINGVVGYSASVVTDFTLNNCTIGKDLASGGTYSLIGNLIQLHIIKGIAKYSSNFTPASRLSQTPNTVLLLQVDKPVLTTDNWTKIQLESVEVIDQPYIYGSSLEEQTSKTLTSVGTTLIVDDPIFSKVLKFDGSNYINISSTQDLNFGTGDFTIETWMKRSTDKIAILFQTDGSNSGGLYLCHDASGYFGFGGIITSFATLKNTWYHIAMVRKSGTYKIFINGTCYLTTTNNNSPSSGNLAIGTNSDWRPQGFEGYIYNLNIIKGEAKYQTDFKPNINFEKVVNTSLLIQPNPLDITIKDPKRKDFFGDKSMIACYMLDSNTKDETGFYNGTLSGSNFAYSNGKFGQCISVNSTNYINLPETLSTIFGTNDFSISLWFKPSNTFVTNNILFATQSSNSSGFFNLLINSNNKISVSLFDGGSRPVISHQDNINLTDWNHAVVTKKSNVYTIYSNNIISGSTLTNALSIACADIRLGQNPAAPSLEYFNGQIDNVKIFNRALTDSEVISLYNEIISPVITLETETETIASEPDFFNDKSNIATYLFDNNVNDANGKYNGIATNITYGDGKFGKCINFLTHEANVLTPEFNINNLTFSFWFKCTNINGISDHIIGEAPNSINCRFIIGVTATSVYITFGGDPASNFKTLSYNGITPNDGNWHHIVFGATSLTSGYLYVDNIFVGTISGFVNNSGLVPFYFAHRSGYTDTWKGQLDNVRIFNRSLTASEVQDLYRETKRVKYKAITLDETNFGPASKFSIETQKEIKLLNYKTWTGTDATSQGYRIYPVMNILDHTAEETTFNPKYYLGTKYQRNLSEILSQGIKSKRTIFNLKDMYLVDDQCIQTLKKINILLENNQMIKLTERLYNLATPLREKLNADLILEYLSTPVSDSSNSDIAATLKTSLIEDYNFTQEEITNLNDNINTFKSRARIALNTPVIQGSGLDQLRFNLPKTFVDGNRSKTEKKNLLVFGTNAGFNKFNLAGYTAPYSNVSKRETSAALDYNNLILGLPVLSKENSTKGSILIDEYTKLLIYNGLDNKVSSIPVVANTITLTNTVTKTFTNSIDFTATLASTRRDFSFPKSNDFVFGTNDFSIETMVYLKTMPTSNTTSTVSGAWAGLSLIFGANINSGDTYFAIGSANIVCQINGTQVLSPLAHGMTTNTWYKINISRTSGILSFSINDVSIGTVANSTSITYANISTTVISIGCWYSSKINYMQLNGYMDYIKITNGITIDNQYTNLNTFKDILTNYKQQIPFTYIPLSTDAANTNNEPVFENLTDITGFNNSDIIIDIPNVL